MERPQAAPGSTACSFLSSHSLPIARRVVLNMPSNAMLFYKSASEQIVAQDPSLRVASPLAWTSSSCIRGVVMHNVAFPYAGI
jgi:hypothetical protein